ncbi:conjugative transposon protein TraN [Sphingobacterium sp. SGL-16]|uniref:conjugative transposon protein TraN n=1 Tax=Sphingobacterium sp. SGL-16 TaxID=2710883 RepID=UPI001F0F6258|nr:conjugative transposon protein TraN [Sphingobacterium sp. SGL-16]
MKVLFLIVSLYFTVTINLLAQNKAATYRENLTNIVIDNKTSLHIISPEPIRYVDISTHKLVGDLPESHVVRLKLVHDSLDTQENNVADLGVVTIVGESFIAQYNLSYLNTIAQYNAVASFDILPHHTKPITNLPEITTKELHQHALSILNKRKSEPIRQSNNYGIRAELGAIYTVGDLVLLDITYYNATKLSYDMDELRFKIEDKKITKATNVQSIEIKPIWQLYPHKAFKKQHRNIYVFKKVTFPDNKILHIELSEKQISGRTITLKIKYRDILQADTF